MLIIISQRFINKYLNTQPSYARSKHNGRRVAGGGAVRYGTAEDALSARVMCLAGAETRSVCVCICVCFCDGCVSALAEADAEAAASASAVN